MALDESSPAVQNLSSGPTHSLVKSFAAIKDHREDQAEGGHATSEEQSVMTVQQLSGDEALKKQQPSEVPQQCQREADTLVNEVVDVDVTPHQHAETFAGPTSQNKVAYEDLKDENAEAESSSRPIRCRRGWPPKKTKHLQEPVEEVHDPPLTVVATLQDEANYPTVVEEVEGSSPVDTMTLGASESLQALPVNLRNTSSIITPSEKERVSTATRDVGDSKTGSLLFSASSLTIGYSSEKEKTGGTQQLAPSTESSPASETVNLTSEESDHVRARRTSATLQDAMLLVEAMNRSSEENGSPYSPKRTAAPPQSLQAPHGYTLQTVDEIRAEPLRKVQLPLETLEAAGMLSITKSAAQPQQMIKIIQSCPKVTKSIPANKTLAHNEDESKRQHVVTDALDTTTRPMPSSKTSVQTSAQPPQHHLHLLKTSAAPSKMSSIGPHKIIVVPRLVPSLIHHKIASLSPAKLPTFMSTIVASQNHILPPPATLPHTTPSLSSQKTIHVSSRNMLPVVLSKSTVTSTDQQLGTLPHPKMRITIPRYVPPVVSRTNQSHTVFFTREQASAKPAAVVKVSSIPLMSSSQDLTASGVAQTTANADEVALILSRKSNNTAYTRRSESLEKTASVFEMTNGPIETSGSSSKTSASTGIVSAPVSPVQQKLSPMVRLTKLPPSVSVKESVLVSHVLPNKCFETLSLLSDGNTEGKTSSMVISTEPSEMPVVSTNICPGLDDTFVSVDTSQISEEQNHFQEMTLSSSETCTVLAESPTMAPEKSAEAISETEPSASNFVMKEISNMVPECVQPNEAPTEDKQSGPLIQLTSITSKGTPDHDVQITKAQFLAQLAVLPVAQDPEKVM